MEVYVDPQCKRQGCGRALLQHVEAEARASGSHFLRASTVWDMRESIHFHKACGFAVCSDYDENDIILLKPIFP